MYLMSRSSVAIVIAYRNVGNLDDFQTYEDYVELRKIYLRGQIMPYSMIGLHVDSFMLFWCNPTVKFVILYYAIPTSIRPANDNRTEIQSNAWRLTMWHN